MVASSSYELLVDASSHLAEVAFFGDIRSNSVDDATALLQRVTPILNSAQTALRQRCEVPVKYEADFFSYHMDDLRHLRNLARAFQMACGVAEYNNDYPTLAQYGLVILELANAVRRGGLVVDHLVSIAISGVGIGCLRSVRERFNVDTRRRLIAALQRHEGEREPFADIARRDAKWEQITGDQDEAHELPDQELIDPDSELSVEDRRALLQLIKEFADRPKSELDALHVELERHALARSRLLTVDLAIRSWCDSVGSFPAAVSMLAPDFLASIPRDPFTDGDFIYRADKDSFLLYCTGPDQSDAGGRFGPWPAVLNGGYDLCLDADDYCWDGAGVDRR